MENFPLRASLVILICCLFHVEAFAEEADSSPIEKAVEVQPPKVFLEKSPRIVWFQLNRLDNQHLLLVERQTDDPKYSPVYMAILTRAGMARQDRDEALAGLTAIHKSQPIAELLAALETLDAETSQDRRTSTQLAAMLLARPPAELLARKHALEAATKSANALLRPVGYAGLIAAGKNQLPRNSKQASLDWLAATALIPAAQTRSRLWPQISELLAEKQAPEILRAAIEALSHVPARPQETFQRLAAFVSEEAYRDSAVRTLLTIPAKHRDLKTAQNLAKVLVEYAETTPAAKRTTEAFLNAMQLADQLLASLPVEIARNYRERLRAVTVRVVQIHTIEEEMRYDTPYFAVEAGRPVQIILKNDDLMPHNFVIVQPGALKEVAEEGAMLGPKPGFQGKPYVPQSPKVLYATDMVPVGKLERLTFSAPQEPGEYPFVCTFPRHWMRMYGVMVVVRDLDAWLKTPVKPKDPIGSNREFVKAWSIEDFEADLGADFPGGSPRIGAKLFQEATCAQCHRVQGKGGKVGPELTDVFKRWKSDRKGVLREILDPSHRIEPKYAVRMVLTTDGLPLTGIVTAEDKDSISLLINPEAPKPTVIPRAKIEEMVQASKSMMPKALLDRFTREEVLEILAYLEGLAKP